MPANNALAAIMAAAACLYATGCTWVKLEDAGKRIRVASESDQVSACTPKGEIDVSVKDRIAFVRREAAKVSDELETLARNQANTLGADTIFAKGPVVDGRRGYSAYQCK